MTASTHPPATRRVPRPVWFFLALVGAAGFGAVGGLRGSASFVLGMGLAAAWLGVTTQLVRRAGRRSPSSSMIAAMTSYAALILFFAVLLGLADGDTVRSGAFAGGLVAAAALASINLMLWGGRNDD